MDNDRNSVLTEKPHTMVKSHPSSSTTNQYGTHTSLPIGDQRTTTGGQQQNSSIFAWMMFAIGLVGLMIGGVLATVAVVVVYRQSKASASSTTTVTVLRNGSILLQSPPPYLTPDDFARGKMLTDEQRGTNLADLREELPKQSMSPRANVWRDARYKWPDAQVPYVISSLYNSDERAVIAEAIEEWHSKTCIRFVPKTDDDEDYLELTPNDGTSKYCYSHVGRQGRRQFVKMFSSQCMSVGQYVHELGHAVGFGHEHQRPDRDSYITINWNNIDPKFYYAYTKYTADKFTTMDMPYDYYSIMHYPDYAYSSDRKPAFVPKYPGYSVHTMPVRLSETDVKMVKKYYNC